MVDVKSQKIENFEDCLKKINQVNENSDKGLELEVKSSEDFEIIENYIINFEENKNEIKLDQNTPLSLNNTKIDVNKIDNEYEEWNFVETYTYM